MNWRRGLFRLWMGHGAVRACHRIHQLREIKKQFDDAAIVAAKQTASEPVTSRTDYEVGIGPNQPLGQHLGPGQALHSAFRWWCWFSEHPNGSNTHLRNCRSIR